MAGSILDAFNDALSNLPEKTAPAIAIKNLVEKRENRLVELRGTLHIEIKKASHHQKLKHTSPNQAPLSIQEQPDTQLSSGAIGRRSRKGGGNDLIVASLLPGAPRPLVKRRVQKPPLIRTVPAYPHLHRSKPVKAAPSVPATVLKVEPSADLVWSGDYQGSFRLLKVDESNGIPEQIPGPLGRDRELVVGLDFGTSCVKVVVGDRGASKAYAVPFLDASGVNAYLLPSRLFEQAGIFSLSDGADVHRDLKLRFLANPTSSHLQETLVGFLALVIRRCRFLDQ
jgi:hypothetical protein